ncbi:MAG: response regulator [Wujia sp.]
MDRHNILIVDDDKSIVDSMGKCLRYEGFDVYEAYNGEEALDFLVGKDIHLIIMDVMMPKLDGLSALMKIREQNNIPVIMHTRESFSKTYNAGFV